MRQVRNGGLRRIEQCFDLFRVHAAKVFQGKRLFQRIPAGIRAHEGTHAGAAAQRLTHIVADGADVRTAGADDFEREWLLRTLPVQHADPVDRDRSYRDFHVSIFPRVFVQPFPIHFDRRKNGRFLFDLTAEGIQYLFDVFPRQRGDFRPSIGFYAAPYILRIRFQTQRAAADVGLRRAVHEFEQPGRLSDADRKNACRLRIQRTGVADLALARQAPQDGDTVKTGIAGRLVQVQDAVHSFSPAFRTAASSAGFSRRTASSMPTPFSLPPLARRCPPPSNARATAFTSA